MKTFKVDKKEFETIEDAVRAAGGKIPHTPVSEKAIEAGLIKGHECVKVEYFKKGKFAGNLYYRK
jgi:hypothetical protein